MKKVVFKLGDPCSALCTNRDGTLLAAVGRRGKRSMSFATVKKKMLFGQLEKFLGIAHFYQRVGRLSM